jgi:hypothetical protein
LAKDHCGITGTGEILARLIFQDGFVKKNNKDMGLGIRDNDFQVEPSSAITIE